MKKGLALLLALLLLLSLAACGTKSAFSQGEGGAQTGENPSAGGEIIPIASEEDFAKIENNLSGNYRLDCNLSLSDSQGARVCIGSADRPRAAAADRVSAQGKQI